MRELAEIDSEQTRVGKLLNKLERDKIAAQETLARAKNEREQLALVALTGDSAAETKLKAARVTCRETEMLLDDVDAAIRSATTQLETLAAKRAEAIRRSALEEYKKIGLEIVTSDGARLEAAFELLHTAKSSFVDHIRQMDRLAAIAEIESPRHASLLKNFRRSLDAKLNISPVYLEKQWREIWRSPFPAVFERALAGQADDGAEQQRAAN